jgi:hypothetical protein
MSAKSLIAAALLTVLVPWNAARSATPILDGAISGIELAPQSIAGAAIFVFAFDGELNGRDRRGFGWIAVQHEELPDELTDEPAAILDGVGEIYIGLRRFDIDVAGGTLELSNLNDPDVFDDDFTVTLSVQICNFFGQCAEHTFAGELSHVPVIPTIDGTLVPGSP